MSYFKAKMHQIRFRLGLGPRAQTPLWSLQRSPRPPSCINGTLLLRGWRERKGMRREGGERLISLCLSLSQFVIYSTFGLLSTVHSQYLGNVFSLRHCYHSWQPGKTPTWWKILVWICLYCFNCSKWKKTLAYLLVLPGSRARIVRCGGRYDPQLVKRSSEWVSEF